MAKKPNIERQLQEAIRGAAFTPAELARRSGVAPPAISYFLSGKRSVTMTTAVKLADVLGLELRPIKRKRLSKKERAR